MVLEIFFLENKPVGIYLSEDEMTTLKLDTKRRIIVSLAERKAGQEVIDALEKGISGSFERIQQPVGLKDPQNLSLQINDLERRLTVSVTPGAESYTYFVEGKEIEVKTSKSIVWPDQSGLIFFYLEKNGKLNYADTYSDDIITKYSIVSIIYWDSDESRHIYFADERHGIHMSDTTHLYLHRTRGAAFDYGLKLVDFQVDGDGSEEDHAKFTSEKGQIWDEDIIIPVPSQASFPIFYRLGEKQWKEKQADDFPIIYNGTVGYTGDTVPYNKETNGVWSLEPVSTNKFVLVHVFATNDIEFPVIGILGKREYNSKSDARLGAVKEIQEISDLPVAEFCSVGTVIFQTSGSYTNTPKAKIVSTDLNEDYADHRAESIRPGALA